MQKEWWVLMAAGVLEVVWVSGLKHAEAWWEWAITATAILITFKILLCTADKLPLGTVYAVFTGLGTAGTVISEMVWFGEAVRVWKLIFIAALAAGVIGLKQVTQDAETSGGESHVMDNADCRRTM